MKNYQIVTDSGANLPDEIIDQYQLPILSLFFLIDGQEYKSYDPKVKTDNQPFYQMLRAKKNITTSAINRGETCQVFEQILQEEKDILFFSISSGISGGFQIVESVFAELQEKYPKRKMLIIDSLGAGLGEGSLVLAAVKMQNEGLSLEETYHRCLKMRDCTHNLFTIDTLYYLVKGGRVSKSVGFISSALNIKPILRANAGGKIVTFSKTIGRKRSLTLLADLTAKMIDKEHPQTIYISHGDCLDDALFLQERIKKLLNTEDFIINCLDLVMGSHAGPGMVGVFFVGQERSK